MTSRATKVGLTILIVLACGLGYGGWRMLAPSGHEVCEICNRPIHAQSRTVGEIGDGREEVFCCPTCALTAHHQTGEKVKITQLTDFDTDRSLAPDDAYVVEGSTLNLCIKYQPLADKDKQPTQMAFDRCSPSIYAFSSEAGAERFAREHGGTVHRFQELAAAYQR
jgi:hypothetical protein